jgi:hypothetical protein
MARPQGQVVAAAAVVVSTVWVPETAVRAAHLVAARAEPAEGRA